MKSEREIVSKVGLKAVLLEQYGVDLVLTKSRNKSRLDRGGKNFYTRSRTASARMRLAVEGPEASAQGSRGWLESLSVMFGGASLDD